MPYIPSQEKMLAQEARGKYIPSEEKMRRQQPEAPSIGQQALGVLGRIGEIPVKTGAAIAQSGLDIASLVGDIPRQTGRLARYLGVPGVQRLADLPPTPHPQAPLYDPGAPESKVVEYGPIAAGGVGLAGVGLRALSRAGTKLGEKALERAVGEAPKARATNWYKRLLGNTKLGGEDKAISHAIRKEYLTNKRALSKEYTNVFKEGEEAGYSLKAGKPGLTEALGMKPTSKRIVDSEFAPLGDALTGAGVEIKNALVRFQKNASFKNAHKLQSKLGSEAERYRLLDSTKNIELTDAREALKRDIVNSLGKTGDVKLATRYADITNRYAQEVAPFLQNNAIRKIAKTPVRKTVSVRKNIHNLLQSDDPGINAIKNMLSPKTRELILAKALRGGKTVIKHPRKGIQVNPDKILDNFYQLEGKGFGEFIEPHHGNFMAELGDSVELKNKLSPYFKAAGKSVAYGVPALIGLKAYKRF